MNLRRIRTYAPLGTLVVVCSFSVLFAVQVATSCESFIDPKGRSSIDFAPLSGLIDICSRDELMCFLLMVDSPESRKTLAVFVSSEEWERSRKFEVIEHSRSMSVQRVDSMSIEKFKNAKDDVRKRAYVSDQNQPVGALQLKEDIPLGVVEEADDMISTARLARLTPPTNEGLLKSVTTVSVLTLLRLKSEILFLETTEQWMFPFYSGPEPSSESTKRLAKQWLDCIRDKNRN